jgi:uncharacterized protein (TIGR02246 family)
MRTTTVTTVFVLALVAAISAQSAQNRDQALMARSQELMAALKSKDAAKVASFYTEDAVAFSGAGPLVRGRAAIQKDLEEVLKLGLADSSMDVIDATTSGNLGYVFGRFSGPPAGPDKKRRTGNYLQIWKRVGSEWLMAYETLSPDYVPRQK